MQLTYSATWLMPFYRAPLVRHNPISRDSDKWREYWPIVTVDVDSGVVLVRFSSAESAHIALDLANDRVIDCRGGQAALSAAER
jgi:hypothetical protein